MRRRKTDSLQSSIAAFYSTLCCNNLPFLALVNNQWLFGFHFPILHCKNLLFLALFGFRSSWLEKLTFSCIVVPPYCKNLLFIALLFGFWSSWLEKLTFSRIVVQFQIFLVGKTYFLLHCCSVFNPLFGKNLLFLALWFGFKSSWLEKLTLSCIVVRFPILLVGKNLLFLALLFGFQSSCLKKLTFSCIVVRFPILFVAKTSARRRRSGATIWHRRSFSFLPDIFWRVEESHLLLKGNGKIPTWG